MVWIDVTEIKNWEGNYTGIQRVISKIGAELLTDTQTFGTCYFDYSTGVFRSIDYSFRSEAAKVDINTSLSARAKRKLIRKAKAVNARLPEEIKEPLRRVVKAASIGNIKDPAIDFRAGDVLLIPGAFWIYPIEKLQALKSAHNIKVAGVLYDLVPLVVPQFTAKVTVDGFGARFAAAMSTFDQWFAISENTKKDALAEVQKYGIVPGAIDVIKLGVDIVAEIKSQRPPTGFNLGKNEFSLFVSTLEARKNQALIYQAVKRIKEKSGHHNPIVLVGKHGWLSDDIIYILQNDVTVKDNIIWLSNVDDGELQWLYANCRFTIYPSFYEGWGLPVAESLALGAPCIISNTSSLPEAGGKHVEYFSPYSSDELAELLVKLADDRELAKLIAKVKGYEPQTWKQCATAVRRALTAHS